MQLEAVASKNSGAAVVRTSSRGIQGGQQRFWGLKGFADEEQLSYRICLKQKWHMYGLPGRVAAFFCLQRAIELHTSIGCNFCIDAQIRPPAELLYMGLVLRT